MKDSPPPKTETPQEERFTHLKRRGQSLLREGLGILRELPPVQRRTTLQRARSLIALELSDCQEGKTPGELLYEQRGAEVTPWGDLYPAVREAWEVYAKKTPGEREEEDNQENNQENNRENNQGGRGEILPFRLSGPSRTAERLEVSI